jgi:HEAT repeat protein
VVIKRSAGQETQALIEELGSKDEVRRETAIARLAVIGTRAVDRLLAALARPAPALTRVSALRALESIADVRSLAPALALLQAPEPEVAAAAADVVKTFLHSRQDAEVLDHLVALALDTTRPDTARLAALDAMTEMESRALEPVWKQLGRDPSAAVRQRAAREQGRPDPAAELEAAATGSLPDDPSVVESLIETASGEAPLATLHRLLEAVRRREERAASRRDGEAWRSARGALHLALATRRSRVALYDLRESVERTHTPLPASFLLALAAVGDAGTLEAIAAAYARADGTDAPAWLEQLKAAFASIAAREGVTARHGVVKRIRSKFPGAAGPLLSTLLQSTRASKRPSRT